MCKGKLRGRGERPEAGELAETGGAPSHGTCTPSLFTLAARPRTSMAVSSSQGVEGQDLKRALLWPFVWPWLGQKAPGGVETEFWIRHSELD